jgi:hypothetical protein
MRYVSGFLRVHKRVVAALLGLHEDGNSISRRHDSSAKIDPKNTRGCGSAAVAADDRQAKDFRS